MRGWAAVIAGATAFGVVLAACAPTVTELADPSANATDSAVEPIDPVSDDTGREAPVDATGEAAEPGTSDTDATAEATIEFVPAVPLPGPWELVEVIDGDTLDVALPDASVVRVRLIGINAPERGECLYEEATETLRALASGGEIVLVADLSEADRFGRKLRYVEVEGQDAGATLIRLGLAVARSYPPDTLRDFSYRTVQGEAEAAGVGRWDEELCDSNGAAAPDDVSIAIEVRADADGDDELNLNDEWVRFTNTGDVPVDLDGWTVADASIHRYTFGRLAIQPGSSVTLYTGCGVDSLRERFWCNRDSAIWNNDADVVRLLDALGKEVVSHRYATGS